MTDGFRRQCGWCESVVPGIEPVNCPNCAGPLPMLPMVLIEKHDLEPPGPGNRPPDGPREIPPSWIALRRKQAVWAPVMFIAIGFFCWWTIIAPIWAVWVLVQLLLRGNRVTLIRDGDAVLGKLTDVRPKERISDTYRRQVIVEFEFELDGQRYQGKESLYDVNAHLRRPGDPMWVIYDPKSPKNRSTLWPPGPGAGKKT